MTSTELFKCTPESETYDLDNIIDQLPEIDSNRLPKGIIDSFDYVIGDGHLKNPNQCIKVKNFKETTSDGYRGWWLYGATFNDKPFIIIQRAGRGGRDHSESFIVDFKVYIEAIQYLLSLIQPSDHDKEFFIVDPDLNVSRFYQKDYDEEIRNRGK